MRDLVLQERLTGADESEGSVPSLQRLLSVKHHGRLS